MKGINTIGAGLLVGAALATAGTAHADNFGSRGDRDAAAYAREVTSVVPEATGMAANGATIAAQVCSARATGMSETRAINSMASDPDLIAKSARKSDDPSLPLLYSQMVVMSGEWHFCPEYATAQNEGEAEDARLAKLGYS